MSQLAQVIGSFLTALLIFGLAVYLDTQNPRAIARRLKK